MGIAKNLRTLHPNGAVLADDYKVKHSASQNGGEYSWETSNGAMGAVPYGGSMPQTQRQAMAHVALRIRSVVNNRSKTERHG
jgi:hypothetical protein